MGRGRAMRGVGDSLLRRRDGGAGGIGLFHGRGSRLLGGWLGWREFGGR